MKLETFGWWVFLVSTVFFLITLIYEFGMMIVKLVLSFLRSYHVHATGILFWSVLGSLIGVLLIKLASNKSDDQNF
jgi:hypothetical protein